MNNNILIQDMRTKYFPFYSFYSYRKPKFLDKKDLEYEDLIDIYDDITHGFYMTRFDKFKLDCQKNWKYTIENKDTLDTMLDLLNELSRNYIYARNGKIYINQDRKDCEDNIVINGEYSKFNKWQIIKKYISEDLIIANFLSYRKLGSKDRNLKFFNGKISSASGDLSNILKKGIAELHMHMGATRNFDEIWIEYMNTMNIKLTNDKVRKLYDLKIKTYEGKKSMKAYIESMAILRMLMGYFLENNGLTSDNPYNNETLNDEYFIDFIKERFNNLYNDDSEENNNTKNMICKIFKHISNGEELQEIKNFQYVIMILKNVCELDDYSAKERTDSDSFYSRSDDYRDVIIRNDPLSYIFKKQFVFYKNSFMFSNNSCSNIELDYLPEHVFLVRSLDFIRSTKNSHGNNKKIKTDYERLFFQYIKIKNMIYKYHIQLETSGKGLDIFSKDYYSKLRQYNEQKLLSRFINNHCNTQNIQKLEYRQAITIRDQGDEITLRTKISDVLLEYLSFLVGKNISKEKYLEKYYKQNREKFMNEFEDNINNKNSILIGIVYSFLKRKRIKNDKTFECRYLSIDDKVNHSDYFEKKEGFKRAAEAINKIRYEIPNLDHYLVGIDAASRELDTDPYYFKEAYNILRSYDNISLMDDYYNPRKTIGFTYHVGEEFRDIISGLRHVDEVVEKLEFKSGDRLGHAVVLGVDIDKWVYDNEVITISNKDYLLNLVWEWSLYNKDYKMRDCDNISYLENQILKVANNILGFNEGLSVDDLAYFYDRLFDDDLENDVYMYKDSCPISLFTKKRYYLRDNNIKELGHSSKKELYEELKDVKWSRELIKWANDCEYFAEGFDGTVEINVNNYIKEKYKRLQLYMQDKIQSRGIILELNPSSNLTICDFNQFEDYHILKLNAPDKEHAIVTLNTDDPSIFNTSLENEYSLMFDLAMKTENYTRIEVLNWLDRLRQYSMDYSFIEDRNMSKEDIIEEVLGILEKLNE
ncbi:MAG: hypothetical protein N4A54_04670 [Peptostreptococcaceae bacterium]|jgi:adenosine deaminase|nr:hypothetical protein [Peptostreptococcaceae bacterium]